MMIDFNLQNFIDILRRIKPFLIDFHTPGNGIILRHDVDDLFFLTMRAGRIEYEMEIKSTIYILNTATYYHPDNRNFRADLRILQDIYGHEIGWHNNAITEHYKTGTPIREAIKRPLRELRGIGLKVTTTSSHGDPLCYDRHYVNYNIFGIQAKEYDGYRGPVFQLGDFGLTVEAMHGTRDDHLSDSLGKWSKDPIETLNKWSEIPGRYQLLIHPQWWEL